MRILATGGAGFIGSHLVDRFLKEGHSVRILDNLTPRVHPFGAPAYLPPEAEFVRGSVTDAEVLGSALRDIDVVYHQAAYQDYMPDFSKFFSVNVTGTSLIYELIVANSLPVKQVILASSQAVYGEGQYLCSAHGTFIASARSREQLDSSDWEVVCPKCRQEASRRMLDEEFVNPFNPYAVSKFAAERAAIGLGMFYGIPTTALRYSITQGPRQSLHNQYSGIARIFGTRLLAGEPLVVFEDGRQTRDFVHVDDVVEANLFVLGRAEANFQAFNVGSGVATTVLEYAAKLAEKLNKKPEIRVSGEYRVGDNRNSVSSISKLKALGWSPRRDLDGILEDFSEWLAGSFQPAAQLPRAYEEMMSKGVVRKSTR
jgi:dTDP-L-rhamnose 4-epimerase